MRAYVMTRGVGRDYRFVGAAPAEEWWGSLRGLTSFERPTLIVERKRDLWRAYLSGIPSSRRDRVSTRIRHTLVLEGEGGAEAPISSVVGAWLEEVAAAPAEQGALAGALDAALPEAMIEEALEDGEVATDVGARLSRALVLEGAGQPAALAAPPADLGADDPSIASWIAALESPPARRALLARADALLAGRREGVALVLNLASPAEAEEAVAGAPTRAVLLGGLGASFAIPRPLARKKADRPPARVPDGRARRAGTWLWLVAAIVAANLALYAYLSRSW